MSSHQLTTSWYLMALLRISPSLKIRKSMAIKLRQHSLQHLEVVKCFTWTLTTPSTPMKPNKMAKRWTWTKTTLTWWWLRLSSLTTSSSNSKRIKPKPSLSIAPHKTSCFLPLTRVWLWLALRTPCQDRSMDSDSMCKKTPLSTRATARQYGRSTESHCVDSEKSCHLLPIEETPS